MGLINLIVHNYNQAELEIIDRPEISVSGAKQNLILAISRPFVDCTKSHIGVNVKRIYFVYQC